MDLLRCVVLSTLFGKTVGGSFYLTKIENNWTAASRKCKLAAPSINFSTQTITFDPGFDANDVWVGYYQANTPLEYFGCKLQEKNKPFKLTRADPGLCVSACNSKTIGIVRNQCVCFDDANVMNRDDKDTMLPFCDMECGDLNGNLCGGRHRSNQTIPWKKYMSLYRSIGDFPITGNENGGNCIFYDHKGLQLNVCNLPYASLCEKGKSVWIQNKTNNQPYYGNWTESSIECFTIKARPSSYNNTIAFRTEDGTPQLWTGIIRSKVIYKYTSDSTPFKRGIMYGYLKKIDESNTYKLEFTGNWTTRKRSICIEDSPDVGAAVGLSLSIVAIIVIVVVLVLYLRKRGVHLPFLKREKQTQRPSITRNNLGYAISGPVEIQHSTYTTSQNEYAELDLKTTIDNEGANSAINNASETPDYAHNYFVLEKQGDEPYDTTKPTIQKSFPDTHNPYNKLNSEESSGYDHIGNCKTLGGIPDAKTPESENTYNTTSLENSKHKTSTGESNNAYNMTDDTNDAYNHINIPPHKTGQRVPENDYDAI